MQARFKALRAAIIRNIALDFRSQSDVYILVVRFSWTHMMHLHTKKRMIDVSQKVCYKHSKTGLYLFSIKISGEEMA